MNRADEKPTRRKKRQEFRQGQPTLRDVAVAANVSEMTVSRVLRDSDVVSKKTRDKVLEIVDDLGFVPNRVAGSLATASSDLIAVIVPSLRIQVFTEVLAGITDCLESRGYKAVIGISEYDLDKEESLIRSMLSWRPSGLIVANMAHTSRTRKILGNAGVPVVEIMEVEDEPVDSCVGVDHGAAGALTARHLVARGYRRIGYVGWNNRDTTAGKRFQGFVQALAEAGLDLEGILEFDQPVDMERGKQGLGALLADHPDLEAVYFPNDIAAIGGYFHCLAAGIDVPSDLAIAGFSGLKFGQLLPVPLTTVRIGRFEIGQRSASIIIDRLDGEQPPRVNVVDVSLVEGSTT